MKTHLQVTEIIYSMSKYVYLISTLEKLKIDRESRSESLSIREFTF